MIWTDDPLADFYRYDREQAEREESRPTCSQCGEHIMGDYYYNIDGALWCAECINDAKTYFDD